MPFVIDTDGNGSSTTLLQDVALDTPANSTGTIGGVHWRSGRYSMVRRVRTSLEAGHVETNKIDYLIDGTGGGRWYSLANHLNIPDGSDIDCRYRKLVIADTTEPVTFYGLNLERGGNKKYRPQYPFAELRNAQDVRVFGQKMENDGAKAAETDNSCNPPTTNTRTKQPTDKGIGWDIDGQSRNIYMTMIYSNDVAVHAPIVRVGAPPAQGPAQPITSPDCSCPTNRVYRPRPASCCLTRHRRP